jgi:hypothetical protein
MQAKSQYNGPVRVLSIAFGRHADAYDMVHLQTALAILYGVRNAHDGDLGIGTHAATVVPMPAVL